MAKNKKTKKLRFATLMLSGLMLVASSSFLLAACSQTTDDDDDDTSTPTRTDTQTFANADFEYFDDNDGEYLIGSAQSWSSGTVSNDNGVSSSSSVSKSGIVDTSIDWREFYTSYSKNVQYEDVDEKDIPEDEVYYKDIDDYYDVPGWDVVAAELEAADDELDMTEQESIEAHANEIEEAAAALNPGTHWADPETEDEENGTHVLMLHNYRSNKMGTAAQYSSSSITLAAGTAAKFSVWVKTSELTYNDGTPVDGNRGAFIRVSNSVGGTAQDPLIIRNIDTSGVEDNNGWVQYSFYVKASSYASTTFTVVLGLGMQTEGTSSNYYEYVQGYAFFDDLQYEVMTAADYDSAVEEDVPADQRYTLDLSYGSDRAKVDAASVTDNFFALDLNDLNVSGSLDISSVRPELTTDDRGNNYLTYFGNRGQITEEDIDADLAKSGVRTSSQLLGSDYAALSEDFEKFDTLPFGGADEDILLLYSASGAPYTATLNDENVFTVSQDEYMFISFWVKTSDLEGGTGATVTLVDADTNTAIGAVDTTTLATVDLVDDGKKQNAKEYEDIFDGWQLCYFYVTNQTDDEESISFYLEFSFGVQTLSGSSLSSFIPGYAAFTGFEYGTMTEEQYNLKTTGTYAVATSLTGGVVNPERSFDDTSYTDPDAIETDLADLRNYRGVYGGSTYVGGQPLENADHNAINALDTAGLLNRKYAEAYNGQAWMNCILNYADALTMTEELWDSLFGTDCLQPLLIANTVEQAYGFIANSSSTIASSAYMTVSVRVKLSPGATANIYLIDTAEAEFGEQQYTDTVHYTSGVSYRYDSRGNVVNLDPEDDAFDADDNTVLWKLDNGLWGPERGYNGDVYYANLANYETDEDGNLINHDDEIVYYSHDGAYYRYHDEDADSYSVRVEDFTEAGVDLTGAQLQDATDKALMQTVTNDTDEISDWIYVRFFIATGNESKNYRLEVWSGSRDGQTQNAADTFVLFDVVNYESLASDTFDSLLNARLEAYAEELDYADVDALQEAYEADPASFIAGEDGKSLVYYYFSLYDDAAYESYDADYSNLTGDPYADYDQSTYANTVAYFSYHFETENRAYYDTFVDYSASEITVATSSSEENPDEEEDTSTTDESGQNVWLLVSSIVLAIILILTLVLLLLKNLLSNLKKRKAKAVVPTYDNKRKRYIRKLRLEESEEAKPEDDILPDDEDEITEEDIYRVDDGQPEEQPTEGESENDETKND